MICRRCGRNNPTNTHKCIYCGAPLAVSNENRKKKSSQKQSEGIIVALITIMVLLLVSVAGVYIYKNNNTHRTSFGGSGGGSLPPPTFTEETVNPPQTESSEPTDDENTPSPQEQDDSRFDGRLAKKNSFLEKADDIKWYSETYLEAAETQSEINNESSIVYKKWDALLNEVYQYLKTIMSDSEFEELQTEELEWITEKENAIEAAGAEWEGGSGEPMARNLTAIQYTEERCYYLISLIN